MKIGELAQRTNVSTDTLRLYEKQGLIRSERRDNGYRDFDQGMVRLVNLIRLGQKMGFTLREMKEVIDVIANRSLSTEETANLLQQKLDDVDAKIAEMIKLRGLLADTLNQVCPLQATSKPQVMA
ncbi:MAG: MerR family DNA-binding transcriptional regulator [Cognatishimia sp.]|uniref:MerR family DNA-binding transcriptional regulator n=1 Tax=Cognatishimia sp. 1_MG-2023 TaxID=3062642 RepID=UPI0026E16E25|nr:MerR family DNA-binding transcriptional regulator [Cognatishimia sp. 1_MG-2023]MDO6728185.1 MerR family DNA-binding transcriptional regulator [Cognatishimia sp. 1_MG-2023]